jgi:hypothetical protein
MVLETTANTNTDWGLCNDSKWWQIEPEAEIHATSVSVCIGEDLEPLRLCPSAENDREHFLSEPTAYAAGSTYFRHYQKTEN